MKNKMPLIAVAALAAVSIIGGTIAYFTGEVSFENVFNAGTYKASSTETIESSDNWLPGETINKSVATKNEGTIPVAVRVAYDEKWTLENGESVTVPAGYKSNRELVDLQFENTDKWLKGDDEYLYYYRALESGETAEPFISGATLRADLETESTCTTDGEVGKGAVKRICSTSIKGLGKASYTLNISIETVQADQYQNFWTSAPAISGKR